MPDTNQSFSAQAGFQTQFKNKPQIVASAPGRVNLIGGHVDYNDGLVVPMAIDRRTWIAGSANDSHLVNLYSKPMAQSYSLDLAQPIVPSDDFGWAAYIAGVLAGFQERGFKVPGFDAYIDSSIPIGGGLSSSAALEMAVAAFVDCLIGSALEAKQLAMLCHGAERRFAKVPCGRMDQFSVALAKPNHLLSIDCQNQRTELIPWPNNDLIVLIVDSGAPHQLVDGEYALRRQQTEVALGKLGLKAYRELDEKRLHQCAGQLTETEFQRARHVVSETNRSFRFLELINSGSWSSAGQVLFESHASLRDDFQVSSTRLDWIVDVAKELGEAAGVLGARMTGGGFGGCTVWIVKRNRLADVITTVKQKWENKWGQSPTLFATDPSAAALAVRIQ